MTSYRVVGLMSGTSLDGLDIAFCEFQRAGGRWKFSIRAGETVEYDSEMAAMLVAAHGLSGEKLMEQHTAYGRWMGEQVKRFLSDRGLTADFVASHGHTVFHQPVRGFTFQLGLGSALAAVSQLPVVSDFRTKDVALGGQGAPLVPIGDRGLFGEFDYCLNLGGIANISFEEENRRIAYDISPCNLLLNALAVREGLPYDDRGKLAAEGRVIEPLLQELNNVAYYRKSHPKSLGREDIEHDFLGLLQRTEPTRDLLRTVVEHIAWQIGVSTDRPWRTSESRMLITGGGAYHDFLVQRIRHHAAMRVEVGGDDLIRFKEALIFAFLGVLRWCEEPNVLASVTGAPYDHCAGSVDLPE